MTNDPKPKTIPVRNVIIYTVVMWVVLLVMFFAIRAFLPSDQPAGRSTPDSKVVH